MDFIGQLWQPIIMATAACFILSALIWMVAPHHRTEWKAPPNQKGLMDLLKGSEPGAYLFPFADRGNKTAFEEAMKLRAEGAPSGVLFVYPGGMMSMGKMMGQQLVFFLIVNFFIAYVGHHAMLDGQPFSRIFQVTGSLAFMAYFFAAVPESIWFGRPWKSLWMQMLDALIYMAATAAIFAWLWPKLPIAS